MGRGGKGQKEGGKRGEETGNDRTATAGWKRDTFIRLSACVSVGNLLLFLLFIWRKHSQEDRKDEEIQKNATSTQEKVND